MSQAPRSQPLTRKLRASVFALLILAMALSSLWLNQWLSTAVPPHTTIREVALTTPSTPPPPPPPPVSQQQAVEAQTAIQVQGQGPAIPMVEIAEHISIEQPTAPAMHFTPTQWQSLSIDWNAFDLNALDSRPSPITMVKIRFPAKLSSRGINKVNVQLDVIVDEKGSLTLIEIITNPHPELIAEIHRFIRGSRFSPPIKDGQPVRARFILPLEIK